MKTSEGREDISATKPFVCRSCLAHWRLPLWLEPSPCVPICKVWTMRFVTYCGDRGVVWGWRRLICWIFRLCRDGIVYLIQKSTVFQNHFLALTLQSRHFICTRLIAESYKHQHDRTCIIWYKKLSIPINKRDENNDSGRNTEKKKKLFRLGEYPVPTI